MSGIEARLAEVLPKHRLTFGGFVCFCSCGEWQGMGPEEHAAHVAAALAVVVAEEVTAARAEAWDEGYAACYEDRTYEPGFGRGNPYRAAVPPSSIGSGVGGQGGVGHERPLTGPVGDAAPSVGPVDVDEAARAADRRDA